MALEGLLTRLSIGEDEIPDSPAELVDEPEVIEPDPKPSRSSKAPPKAPPPKLTAALRRDVRDKISMGLDMLAMPWAARDPYCAGVFNRQQELIVDRMAAIACRNPRMLAWLTSTGEWSDWIMLLTAVWPVASAIVSHHVLHSVQEEEDPYADLAGVPADGWSGASVPPFQQPAYRSPYSV